MKHPTTRSIRNAAPARRAAALLLTLTCALAAGAQETPAPAAGRINSYEQLIDSLTRADVRFERDDPRNRLKVATVIDGQQTWAEIIWKADNGVCQIVQTLGFRVPPEHLAAVESATNRINHVMSYPGFYINHEQNVPYCQHVVILRPEDGGLPEMVLQQVFRQLRRNVDLFRPALLEVASGKLPADQIVARLSTPDSVKQAETLLQAFVADGADLATLSRQLQPQAGDYARVFKPTLAPQAAAVYGPAWEAGQIVVSPKPGQTTVRVWKATSEELIAGSGDADQFPGGYREVRPHLQPGIVWHRFKFTEPDKTLGMAYDGLVQLDGRWVLFPKPWRVLDRAQPPGDTP